MAHYTYDDNTFDMRTASLMERLHNYFDDASMGDEREDGQLEPLFKFHSLILIADIYEHVRLFLVNRDRRLSEYFSERTIKQCLRNVVDIEELQKRLPELHEDIETIESSMSWASDLLPMAGVEVMPGTDEIKLLHLHGIEALSKDANGNESGAGFGKSREHHSTHVKHRHQRTQACGNIKEDRMGRKPGNYSQQPETCTDKDYPFC